MKFLEKVGFSSEEIENFQNKISLQMEKTLNDNYKLIITNIKYLEQLGVTNYKDIFKNYYELFLMDNSNFIDIFNKYDREDLIEKLNKNIAIVEYL